MKIKPSKAIKHFFPTPSLNMVYQEAVANSIDAGADEITIDIELDSFNDCDSLRIVIEDNGRGFTSENFSKFENLMDTDQEDHKGLGRLVFLNYFKEVEVDSQFEEAKKRTFVFSEDFEGLSKIKEETNPLGTKLTFIGYFKKSIKTYDYVRPKSILKFLELHFFPIFHIKKVSKEELTIKVSVQTAQGSPENDFFDDVKVLTITEIPDLNKVVYNDPRGNLFDDLELYYDINETFGDSSIITSICAEGRTLPLEIVSKEGIPKGYEIIFLLYSSMFDGKVDSSRQKLDIDDKELRDIKSFMMEKVAQILDDEIPAISENNTKIQESLDKRFPHLQGLFKKEIVGLMDRGKSLEIAQKKFLQLQRQVLDTPNDLSDEKYEKSLEVSSRVLMEYVLYRNITIERLKNIDSNHSETDIHNIIVPMKETLRQADFGNDMFRNNAWLLDDKFMSYTTILSDRDMDKVVEEILLDGESIEKDQTRPDITMIFSGDPESEEAKLDVVVVELKKTDIGLAKKEEVISQLRQRARKLLNYYPSKIQRIWFYGIVEFDPEFIRSLKEDEYIEVFSSDNYYYKELSIMPNLEDDSRVPIGVNLLSYKSFVDDAEKRNSTFLNVLKEGFKRAE